MDIVDSSDEENFGDGQTDFYDDDDIGGYDVLNDFEPDIHIQQLQADHFSDSEEEMDDGGNETLAKNYAAIDREDIFVYGKDKKTLWSRYPFVTSPDEYVGVFAQESNLTAYSEKCQTLLESWELFFDFLDKLVEYTNIYIRSIAARNRGSNHCKETDIVEIRALFGVLYMSGTLKLNHTNVEDIWKRNGFGVDWFSAVMGYKRFLFLMRCLRFDDIGTRIDRNKVDRLAAIREIYELFNANIEKAYNCGSWITVDERLEAFRGRCGFKQYMPNKPNKYGIKVQAAVDCESFYTSKIEVYAGKQPDGPYSVINKPEAIVKRITSHLLGRGRNITMDNWYTSYELVDFLRKNQTTAVGTLRKNKAFIPMFLKAGKRTERSSIFVHQKHMSLVSYVPKKNKCVLVLSSLHHDDKIHPDGPNERKRKCLPEIINFYNKTKCGVDTTDQMTATYNVARVSRRWPLTLFYAFLNIGAINSRIIYHLTCSDIPKEMIGKNGRKHYLFSLAKQLAQPHINRRALVPQITNKVPGIQRFAKPDSVEEYDAENDNLDEQAQKARSTCSFCGWRKNRKTKTYCFHCHKAKCREHSGEICKKCEEALAEKI